MSEYPDVYEEHVLNAVDVCSNCFGYVREQRDRLTPIGHVNRARAEHLPVGETASDRTVVEESYYGRTVDQTTVDHPPTETPTDSRRVFCECGAGGAFARHWHEADIDRERFKGLLKQLLRTLDRKRVTVDRKTTIGYALSAFNDRPGALYLDRFASINMEWTVDHCLATGMTAGLAVAARRPTASATHSTAD